jgi:hypothetical protein
MYEGICDGVSTSRICLKDLGERIISRQYAERYVIMSSLKSCYILFETYSGNQNHRAGEHVPSKVFINFHICYKNTHTLHPGPS